MDLRQLEHFVTVADELHFTRAAERLYISQSGLSASVRALEKELGADLFTRNTRQVELTEAGRALLSETRRTLASVAAGKDAVAAVQGLVRGTLSIGTEQCLGVVDVPRELAGFHERHPGVDIRLQQAGSSRLVELVRQSRLDAAFVAVWGPPPSGVTFLPLTSTAMVAICLPSHPLATHDTVDWRRLSDADFVDFQSDWASRHLTDRAFAAAGMSRQVTSEVNDVHTLLELVLHGLGIAIVPAAIAGKKPGELATIPLSADAPTWDVAIAVPTDGVSRAAQTLLAPILARFES